jgi:hypothetical protein
VVGGLSGIDYDASRDSYWVISDDRSRYSPARFYEVKLDFNQLSFDSVDFISVTYLQDFEGNTFSPFSTDPESIRISDGKLYWSSEGQHSRRGIIAPTIWEMTTEGTPLRSFDIPEKFLPETEQRGIRDNLSLESLAISPDATILFSANESSLLQDGAIATLISVGLSRVMHFDVASGQVSAEYVYVIDPVPFAPQSLDTFGSQGLTAMLSLSNTELLMLERSYAPGRGNGAKLYLADTSNASDVSELDSLQGQVFAPIEKTLLLDLSTLDIKLDNLEAMTFGPNFANGNRSLILVSDNNFNATQQTQWLLFEVLDDRTP